MKDDGSEPSEKVAAWLDVLQQQRAAEMKKDTDDLIDATKLAFVP
jgi:hypothetical protein